MQTAPIGPSVERSAAFDSRKVGCGTGLVLAGPGFATSSGHRRLVHDKAQAVGLVTWLRLLSAADRAAGPPAPYLAGGKPLINSATDHGLSPPQA